MLSAVVPALPQVVSPQLFPLSPLPDLPYYLHQSRIARYFHIDEIFNNNYITVIVNKKKITHNTPVRFFYYK